MTYRYELINYLIEKYSLNTYLEIGYQNGICFNNICVENKKAVDPYPNISSDENLSIMTSDKYFELNTEKYDIIFIDGLHTYAQVRKDLMNSLNSLNENGIIVLHDMNPTDSERARSFDEGGVWNGDCYKVAMDIYKGDFNFNYVTFDMDQGCMVIFPSKIIENKNVIDITNDYDTFDSIRNSVLNLKTTENINETIEEYGY